MLKEKECQQKCLDPSKLSFENEKEIKAVLYLKKKKPRKYVTKKSYNK